MRNKSQDGYGIVPVEFELLLACVRPLITKNKESNIYTLADEPIEWDRFQHLAVFHGVYTIVYQYLSGLEKSVFPSKVGTSLRQKSWEYTSRSLQMTGELVSVLQKFEEKGICVIVLKGIPLAYKIYGNMALRPSRDLDILVRPEDVDEARRVIEAQGYIRIYPGFAATSRQLRNWMKIEHHFNYWHQDKQVLIELHWQLGHHSTEIPLADVEHSLTQVKIAGQLINVLGLEEMLLSLALHGASHKWFRLKWLCDIGMIINQGGFSWEKLYTLAERLRVKAALNQAIILSQKLFNVPVPEHITAIINNDKTAQILAKLALPYIMPTGSDFAIHKNSVQEYYHEKKYGFYLQNGWKRKIAYFHSHFSPTDTDIECVDLPDQVYFLYYLIRPWTWFNRRLSALTGK